MPDRPAPPQAAMPDRPAPPQAARGQDLSGLFRGSDEVQALKDPKSGKGIALTSVPAFVAGAALADLADPDDRIVVLTADLSHANRTIRFGLRHPERFFNVVV